MASNERNPQFSNSNDTEDFLGEPLDTLQIQINNKNGMQQLVPALSIGFMEVRQYIHFSAPPFIQDESQVAVLSADEEEWLEKASYLEEDLLWLLKLPYHRFWSQLVYDESLGSCLDSYLSKAPREHDLMNLSLKKDIMMILKSIHRLVFLVFLRTATYKESKIHHMTQDFFGRIIYENFLFDVPKIMDLCVLYGVRNHQIMSKMVLNIFSNQIKYLDDLNEAARITLFAFDTAEEMLFVNNPAVHGGPLKLEGNTASGLKEMSLLQFQDILSYITDTSVTCLSFLEVYSPACNNFYQSGAAARIVAFYEQVFPAVEKDVRKKNKDKISEKALKEIKTKVSLSKSSLVKIFRNLVDTCCIQQILKAKYSDNENAATLETIHVEDFLSVFTEIVTEKYFLRDYNALYPFDNDVELFTESGIKLESERLCYIYSSIHDIPEVDTSSSCAGIACGARPKSKVSNAPKSKSNVPSAKGLHDAAALLQSKETQPENGEFEIWKEDKSRGLGESEMDSIAEQMLSILPHYKLDFIRACLKAHSYNLEEAIAAVFNDWKPPETKSLNAGQSSGASSLVNERKSIFDGDEFDLFSRDDVDMTNVHKGKRNQIPKTYENLSRDKDCEFLKSITVDYCDAYDEAAFNDRFNAYEDEYDDTYDSMLVGVKEPTVEGEPEKEEPEDRKEVDQTQERDTSRDFCENPELRRQRYEERRQSQAQARNKPSYRRGVNDAAQNPSQSRQQKDRHKSQSVNHNRRQQSDYKKSRGMVPFPTR